jgi:hypothetical protein
MPQYRVVLKPDVDRPASVARELANLGDGAFRPALTCSSEEPDNTFARYFFEAAIGETSGSGVLEVNSEEGTICLEATLSPNIQAAHLIDQHLDDTVLLTFFGRNDGDGTGDELPRGTPICFQEQQLGDAVELQLLIEDPERFAIAFHRGPDDDRGLVAELVPQGSTDPCAGGSFLTEVPSKVVLSGERVPIFGECFENYTRRDGPKVFLTATLGSDGSPVSKQEVAQGRDGCDLVAEAQALLDISEDGRMIGWFVPPQNGTCTKGSSMRTHVALGPGTYGLAIGCPACHYANVRIGLPPDPKSDADEKPHRLITHCGLSFPMHYEGRNWLPVDPELRKTFNPPEGFSSDGYVDEGVVREVDDDTLIYISSSGEEVEYEPTDEPRGGCE